MDLMKNKQQTFIEDESDSPARNQSGDEENRKN